MALKLKLHIDAMPSADWIKATGTPDVDSDGKPIIPVVKQRIPKPKRVMSEHELRLHLAGGFFIKRDVSDEPRDDAGRWTDGGGSAVLDKPSTHYLGRDTVEENPTVDPHITELTLRRADAFAENYHGAAAYPNYEEFAPYLGMRGMDFDEEGNLTQEAPEDWKPGSVEAQSEAMTRWQRSFADSLDIQRAADNLLGYEGEGPNEDSAVANARELLSAMANGPHADAVSGFVMAGEGATAVQSHYGPDELYRGVDDSDGTFTAAFRHAMETDSTISWSMASFMEGDGGAESRIAYLADMGGEQPTEVEDPETGEVTEQSPNDNSAMIALRYSGSGSSGSPMLIKTDGVGLSLDGGYEVLSGGEYKVVEMRQATPEEQNAWSSSEKDWHGVPITVVQLHQVANVKLPKGVAVR